MERLYRKITSVRLNSICYLTHHGYFATSYNPASKRRNIENEQRHSAQGLLDSGQSMPGAKYIVFRCSDGYDVGIPLENGMMDGTLLAYDMNLGSPLTTAHGFPVRVIVPGLYGMI